MNLFKLKLHLSAELDNVRQQNVILQKGSSSSIGANHSPLTDSGKFILLTKKGVLEVNEESTCKHWVSQLVLWKASYHVWCINTSLLLIAGSACSLNNLGCYYITSNVYSTYLKLGFAQTSRHWWLATNRCKIFITFVWTHV